MEGLYTIPSVSVPLEASNADNLYVDMNGLNGAAMQFATAEINAMLFGGTDFNMNPQKQSLDPSQQQSLQENQHQFSAPVSSKMEQRSPGPGVYSSVQFLNGGDYSSPSSEPIL
jgi:hypothetical protein